MYVYLGSLSQSPIPSERALAAGALGPSGKSLN